MQLLIGEYAFFVNESKLETFNKPETFQWNTETYLTQGSRSSIGCLDSYRIPGTEGQPGNQSRALC